MIYTVTLNPAIDKELTVPNIATDTVLRATQVRSDVGGKGFNVSRMLATLGAESVALGFAAGNAGEQLQSGLMDLGIDNDFVWVNGETRTNVTIVSDSTHEHIKVNEAGPTVTAEAQSQLLTRIRSLAKAGDWWVLAGSLPPGVSAEFYQQLISILNDADAYTVVDTSGEPLIHACAANPYLVKPNGAEATQLTGETQPLAQATAIQKTGVKNVIISLGKAGALAATPDGVVNVASPTIRESNPIGAGDALVAGVVWGLSQGFEFATALRWGVSAGAAAAASAGTSMSNKAHVTKLFEQSQIIN